MLPAGDDCNEDCLPKYMRRAAPLRSVPTVAMTSLPFAITAVVVGTVVYQRLYPLLSAQSSLINSPYSQPTLSRSDGRTQKKTWPLSAISFSVTIALSTVLAELILCEISNSFDPRSRALVLKFTLSSLVILLVIVTPLLELHSMIKSAGWEFTKGNKARVGVAWVLEVLGFAIWITCFWWIGQGLPGTHVLERAYNSRKSLSEACLERIGIIGISLMALLSGFASVSSLWQTFGVRVRSVSETDIARKQAGLDATREMLEIKRSRLRALEAKMSEAPERGFMNKVIGSIRGNADMQERKSLQMEISGLETMTMTLSSSLSILESRRLSQQRSSTPSGRILVLVSYAFSIYCMYRILATSVATLRRWWRPDTTFSGTDPINNLLALVAKHWDPTLDRLAWSRQIAFLLSGVILLASFNSVLQTVHFFSRFITPSSLLHLHAQANLALLVGQISATYVISSALLLRSNLPREVGSVISDALGAPLDSAFVDRWFESWFLTASGVTAVGLLVARKVGSSGDWDDDEYDVEMGSNKRL